MKKKPVLLAVFAHPDDETFGPGGSLAKLSKTYHVFVLSATKGEAGRDPSPRERRSFSARRVGELRHAAAILGVERVWFLGFADSQLSNSNYHALARAIERYVRRLRPEILMTTEPRGVSGHLDHIAVSMVTHYVFYRSRYPKALLLYARKKEKKPVKQDYFVYRPPGYTAREIGLAIPTADVWDTKVKAMRAHASQIHDVERLLETWRGKPKAEYFLVVTKNGRPAHIRV